MSGASVPVDAEPGPGPDHPPGALWPPRPKELAAWPLPLREAWAAKAEEFQRKGSGVWEAERAAFCYVHSFVKGEPAEPVPVPAAGPSPAPPPAHELPATLDEWLALWKTSATGNEYLRVGKDSYVVYCDRRLGGWRAAVGRTFGVQAYPDPGAAKRALYAAVTAMPPARLAAMHAGPHGKKQ